MPSRAKLLLALLSTTVAIAGAISSADARRLEVSEQGFLVLFREFVISDTSGIAQLSCEVNMEGSFHSRTFSKVSAALIGYVTEAAIHHPCVQGEVWFLNGMEIVEGVRLASTLPWHVTYASFRGTLPRMTSVEVAIQGFSLLTTVFGTACLWQSTTARPFKGSLSIAEGGFLEGHPMGQILGWRADETSAIPKREGSFACPESLVIRSTGTVGTQTGWRLIIVRLVQ
jgi:hypothetical protein